MSRFRLAYAIIYFVTVVVLAISTFCSSVVYGTVWFLLLWCAVGAGLIWIIFSTRLWRRPWTFLLHVSFVVILAGGLLTKLTAREGSVVLSPGRVESNYVYEGEPYPLGFDMELKEFEIQYYPGGEVARDYVSRLLIDGEACELSVNKPLKAGDFILHQASFISEDTTVIGVRADAPGTWVTFVGYGLFLLGGLMCMLRRGRILCLLLLAGAGVAEAAVPVINSSAVDSLARRQVLYQGRVVTVSTVCHDVLRKVYGKPNYKGLSAERTVLSLQAFPGEWADQEIIKSGDGYVSMRKCFDSRGHYVLGHDLAADERVGILLMLCDGCLMQPVEHPALTEAQVEAELLYNRLPLTQVIFISLFVCALLSLFLRRAARVGAWMVLTLQVVVIGVECWLTGHGPFASMFETLQFLVALTILISLTVRPALSIALFAAGSMALVAHLQSSNPMVTPLMPVLHSPWLSMHVTLVMTSYALLSVSSLTALWGIVRPGRAELMRQNAVKLLHPGVFLLGLGIFSGAVWANVSWGRYWGWDPKETWALVTFMLYAVPLHMRRPSLWWIFAPLLSILMTYFGVNYLSSLHAYN